MIPKPGILKWFKFTQNHIAKPQEFIEASNLYNEVENELWFKLHAYPFVRGKLVNERKALDFKSIYVQSFFLWFLILVAIELFIVCKKHTVYP